MSPVLVNYMLAQDAFAENPCLGKQCSFYTHYLVHYYDNGEPKLEHEAFHEAEKQCEAAQQRCQEWMDNPANEDKPFPERLNERANYWERKVCA